MATELAKFRDSLSETSDPNVFRKFGRSSAEPKFLSIPKSSHGKGH